MSPAAAEATGPLSIVLSCPKCGAPEAIDDETISLVCEHCGSLLVVSAPDRVEVYLADGTVSGPEDLLEIVIRYRVQAHRAEVISKHSDSDGNPPPEMFIQMALARVEAKLRQTAKLSSARRVFVPYWHISGRIVQGVLGRQGQGPKLTRVRAYAVEHTVPAYDPARANLRDKGLRLSRSRVRPLTTKDVAELKAFLPHQEIQETAFREIDRYQGRELERGTESVTRLGRFLFSRRVLVYRPYWLARFEASRKVEWMLFDGGFGTIAGHPDEVEARSLLAQAKHDPLHSSEPSYRRVTVIASRCPDCGHEQAFDSRDHVGVCPNCQLALELLPSGVAVRPYAHVTRAGASALDATYLPFWCFPFEVRVAGGSTLQSLEAWTQAVVPAGLPAGAGLSGPEVWVPALRLLGTEPGDEAWKALVEWAHTGCLPIQPAKVPLGGQPRFLGSALTEVEARELIAFALLGSCGKVAAAKLNALTLKQALFDARIQPGPGRLIYVPFQSTREGDLVAPSGKPRLPRLLVTGGPELDQMRETVWGR